jgi:hypothetical protein
MKKVDHILFEEGKLLFSYYEEGRIKEFNEVGSAETFKSQSGINIMIHSLQNRMADLQKEIEKALNEKVSS